MKKFLLSLAAFVALTASASDNHVLKLSQSAAKSNPWDTQVFINIKNLNPAAKYTIQMDVKGGAEFTLGTETIDDKQTEHMTEWNASAVFNYTDEIKVSTEWSQGVINAPGVTDVNCHTHCTPKTEGGEISHSNGSTSSCDVAVHKGTEYAATAILLNVGKTEGELCIDNIVVKDENGVVVFTEDFEDATVGADNKANNAYFPGWQGAAWEIAVLNMDGSQPEPTPEVKEPEKVYTIKTIDKVEEAWDSQLFIVVENTAFAAGDTYEFSMDVKADKKAASGGQFHSVPGAYQWWNCVGNVIFDTDWSTFSFKGTVDKDADGATAIAFNLNDFADANNYYIGNICIKINGKEVETSVKSKFDRGEIVGIKSLVSEADAVAYDLFGNAGATQGFMVKGGKKVYVK